VPVGEKANKRLWGPHGGFHTARARRWACGAPPPAGNESGEVDDLASLREARVSLPRPEDGAVLYQPLLNGELGRRGCLLVVAYLFFQTTVGGHSG